MSWHVTSKLRTAYPASYFVYIDLGSFLTDLSQFNDPYSFLAQKRIKSEMPVPGGLQLGDVAQSALDELLGTAGSAGTMAAYFKLIARVLARLVFCELGDFLKAQARKLQSAPANQQRSAQAAAQRLGQSLARSLRQMGEPASGARDQLPTIAAALQSRRIPPADFEALFEQLYTQYFPHEHMDMPPWELPAPGGRAVSGMRLRGLSPYLDDYTRYLVESFAALEDEMLRLRDYQSMEGRMLLARVGHLLHAVEDFYFHSNFAEWHQLQARGPALQHPRDLRKHRRRLRYPRFEHAARGDEGFNAERPQDFHPSTSDSDDLGDWLYTGFFGSQDMGHSIADGIHGLTGFMAQLLGAAFYSLDGAWDKLPVLLRLVVDDRFRAQAARRPYREILDRHRSEILFGVFPHVGFTGSPWQRTLRAWQADGFVSAVSAADLSAAFELDVKLILDHSVVSSDTRIGIGAAVIALLLDAEREGIRSEERSAELDGLAAAKSEATYNGASEETIGTHSLMSKDSKRKSPFRTEAFAAAAEASLRIAERLMSRQGLGEDHGRRVDWAAMLHEYLRFPESRADSWESRAILSARTRARSGSRSAQPGRDSARGVQAGFWTNRQARSGWGVDGARAQLESRYVQLESPAESGSLARWLNPPTPALPEPAAAAEQDGGAAVAPTIRKPAVEPPRRPQVTNHK